jgi:hypothetical protein
LSTSCPLTSSDPPLVVGTPEARPPPGARSCALPSILWTAASSRVARRLRPGERRRPLARLLAVLLRFDFARSLPADDVVTAAVYPDFILTDQQWSEIIRLARIASLAPDEARQELQNVIGMYRLRTQRRRSEPGMSSGCHVALGLAQQHHGSMSRLEGPYASRPHRPCNGCRRANRVCAIGERSGILFQCPILHQGQRQQPRKQRRARLCFQHLGAMHRKCARITPMVQRESKLAWASSAADRARQERPPQSLAHELHRA